MATVYLACAQVHNQGAGQVDIYAALTYGLQQRMTPSAVSLGACRLAAYVSLQHDVNSSKNTTNIR